MSQQTIKDIFYGAGGSQDGSYNGHELFVIDTTTAGSPDSSSTYVTKAGSLSALATWMKTQMPAASSSVDGFMSHTMWTYVNTLTTAGFDGTWGSISGKPTFAAVAISGDYNDLGNLPTTATDSTDGLMSAADKTKLDDVPSSFATVASSGAYSDLTGTPAALPPNGAAGGDLTGTYPNPTLASPITHGQTFGGAVTATAFIAQLHDYGSITSSQALDFTANMQAITTLTDSTDTTVTFIVSSRPGFCVWVIKSPATGTIPNVSYPATVIGTIVKPSALNKTRVNVLFNDGTNQHVVYSSPADF